MEGRDTLNEGGPIFIFRKEVIMEDKEWLRNLDVGDEIFVNTSNYGNFDGYFSTITRITKLYFIEKFHKKFRKYDGYQPGDSWNYYRIEPITDYIRSKMKLKDLRVTAIRLRGDIVIPKTEKELIEFIKSIKPFVRKYDN